MGDMTLSVTDVVGQLRALGVRPGMVLVVHTAFSRVRPIEGGPEGLVGALREALGPEGTLVMPTMADDDETPFDPASTPCRGMGIVAERFWRMPGVLRTDSPHGFAAIGPHAAAITADQDVRVPHGPDSPVGRAYARDGRVLLLGVGHEANTTAHLAEEIAGVRYRQPHVAHVMVDGRPTRIAYDEPDHCCLGFAALDGWLAARGLQQRGRVGHAEARFMRAADVVCVATARLAREETVFLHPPGTDPDCDAAWAAWRNATAEHAR